MILVTGGAFQGKRRFAETFVCQEKKGQNLPETAVKDILIIDGETKDWQKLCQADIIVGIHRWIGNLLGEGKDPYAMTQKLLGVNPKVVITLDQVGCGVVPVKASDRQYRETVGRIGCMLAEQAKQVYLLNCGIAKKIK
ncbi:MAG: hypothetical protein HFI70_16285 [Lachnospiraceae bacterium]|nr:hypothetical protein [Lachnospiraceae bacterium]